MLANRNPIYQLPVITGYDLDTVTRAYADLKSCFFIFTSASIPMTKLYDLFSEVARVDYDSSHPQSKMHENLTPARLIKLFNILILADKNKDPKTFKAFQPLKDKFGPLWEVLFRILKELLL